MADNKKSGGEHIFRLSHSSANLMRGCEQRFFHHKGLTPKDSDYVEDMSSLILGKVVHYVLEMGGHQRIKTKDVYKHIMFYCAEHKVKYSELDVPLIVAMVLKYFKFIEKNFSDYELVVAEKEIKTPTFLGYIDAIFKNSKTGEWFICDLKTARLMAASREKYKATLANDYQLNLYSYYAKDVGSHWNLDPEKFKGAWYRVVSKPRLKRRNEGRERPEEDTDYIKRLYKKVECLNYFVPLDLLNPDEFKTNHDELHKRGFDILNKKVEPKKNFKNCMDFFRPCPWWSKCHGDNYSNLKDNTQVKEVVL